jgi:hypothetical protein
LASTRQSEALASLERNLAEQNLGAKCAASAKAANEMELKIKEMRQSNFDLVKKLFGDEMSAVRDLRAAGRTKLADDQETLAVQAMIERMAKVEAAMSEAQNDLQEERLKCQDAIELVHASVKQLSAAQADLDIFIQSDAKTPFEVFAANLSLVKPLEDQFKRKSESIQSNFDVISNKINAAGNAVNAIKAVGGKP